jgi:hypothetical protein
MARVLVGLTELVAALLLLIAAIASSTGLAVVGAIIVILTMIGAVATHARIGDPAPKMAPAMVLGSSAFCCSSSPDVSVESSRKPVAQTRRANPRPSETS